MSTDTAQKSSVASQQKIAAEPKLTTLTNPELHRVTLARRDKFYVQCVRTQNYAINTLLPACEEIIRRYKMQGVAAKDRPNGKPTVEAYFKSIKLNYNTVRGWIRSKRLQSDMFQPGKPKSIGKAKKRELTMLESRLLGSMDAAHDLLEVLKKANVPLGSEVDEAIKDFEDNAPTRQRIEEFRERPLEDTAVDKLKGLKPNQLAMALSLEMTRLIEESGSQAIASVRTFGNEAINDDGETFSFEVRVLKGSRAATTAEEGRTEQITELSRRAG